MPTYKWHALGMYIKFRREPLATILLRACTTNHCCYLLDSSSLRNSGRMVDNEVASIVSGSSMVHGGVHIFFNHRDLMYIFPAYSLVVALSRLTAQAPAALAYLRRAVLVRVDACYR